jgi:hypothetical protein
LLAALTLQRPFIELATLHVYWRVRPDGFKSYYRWLESGVGKPPFKNYLNDLFTWLPTADAVGTIRSRKLRNAISELYTQACSYTHVARQDGSFVALSGGTKRVTPDGSAAALVQATIGVRQVLYLLALAHPMILFPRPIHKKFAFSGPAGLFAPHEASALFDAAVGRRNSQALRESLQSHPDVVSRLEWFDSHPDLSDVDIEREWQEHLRQLPAEFPPTELNARIAMARAQHRGIGWVLNYSGVHRPYAGGDDAQMAEELQALMKW